MTQKLFRPQRAFTTALLTASALAVAGCGSGQVKTREGQAKIDPRDMVAPTLYPALHETVGEYAILLDSQPLYVEGYGVVAELPGTGSGEMPPAVREVLSEMLYKAGAGSPSHGTEDINPDQILRSNQIAAVKVRGVIPPLAKRGAPFDLVVSCLPNSEATSLSGGLLWTTELKVTAQIGNDTKPIAMGRGPVFLPGAVDAISGEHTAGKGMTLHRAVREGRIIGGGRVGEDREVRLQLYNPQFGTAAAIERAINSRFPAQDKVASADSDSIISLNIPSEYDSDPMEFIEIVKHMYLRQETPGFSEMKAKQLIAALKDPAAPDKDISIALQALGRSVLPDYIEPQYTNPDPRVRFWCARAGAGLNDVGGMVVLQSFAEQTNSPFQKEAIDAITELSRGHETQRATETLVDLLKSNNVTDRIAAYRSLVSIGSPAVHSYSVGRKFWMDIVDSDGPPLIYVTQVGVPRIALIGKQINLGPGLVYLSKDNALTVSVPTAEADSATPDDNKPVVTASAAAGGLTLIMGSGPGAHKSPAPDDGKLTITPATQPAAAVQSDPTPQNVTLYWVSPMNERGPVEVKTSTILSHLIARLGWIPDPRLPADPSQQYIGASFQRITEMLAAMSRDQLIEAQFAMEDVPKNSLRTPDDIINSMRPEGFSTPGSSTQPAPKTSTPQAAPTIPPTLVPPPVPTTAQPASTPAK